MSLVAYAATIAAAGTPQPLSNPTAPGQPQIIMMGVTYPAGSATQRGKLLLQAAPGNTGAKIYVGNKAMSKTTLSGVGMVLDKAALGPTEVGEAGLQVTLDELYVDADTTGDKVLVSLID